MPRLIMELSAIPQEGISQHFISTGSALGIVDTELSVTQLVEIECQFYKVNQEVIVQGRLRSDAHLTCSRCGRSLSSIGIQTSSPAKTPVQAISSERTKELEQGETDVYAYA